MQPAIASEQLHQQPALSSAHQKPSQGHDNTSSQPKNRLLHQKSRVGSWQPA